MKCQTAFFLKKNATCADSAGYTYSDFALMLCSFIAGALVVSDPSDEAA
jgi:hypothetical protein